MKHKVVCLNNYNDFDMGYTQSVFLVPNGMSKEVLKKFIDVVQEENENTNDTAKAEKTLTGAGFIPCNVKVLTVGGNL